MQRGDVALSFIIILIVIEDTDCEFCERELSFRLYTIHINIGI